MFCSVTQQLSGAVDEIPPCLKDEIRSDVLEKRRRIGQALP